MSHSAPTPATEATPSGYPAAFGAYLIWGFLPLYLITVSSVPAFEFVGWRIIWTVPLAFLIVALRSQGSALREAVTNPRTLTWLFVSAALIGANWLIYIWAIQNGFVLATSMGYYLNPLLNVALGTLLLGETLSRAQWVAVGLAALAVASLLGTDIGTLLVALSLAGTFGFYGLVRKQVPVGALPGLTIESAILFLPSVGLVGWYAASAAGSSFGNELGLSALIMLGGVFTAIPLLLFAVAARRLPYSTLGFIQFIAPTIVFVLGLTVFGEPLERGELVAFLIIWVAVALFALDLWRRRDLRAG